MKTKSYIVLFITLICTLLYTCKEAIIFPDKIENFSGRTGIPIINANIKLSDVINEFTFIEVNAEGFYDMVIKPDAFDFITAENLIKLPSNLLNIASVGTTPEAPAPASENTISFSTSVGIDFNTGSVLTTPGTNLNRVFLKDGTISLSIANKYTGRSLNPVTITFSNIKTNITAVPLVLTSNTAIASNASAVFTGNLKDYYIDLSNGSTLEMSVSATMTSGTATTGSISISGLSLDNLLWKRLDGKFGSMQIPIVENGIEQIYITKVTPFSSNIDNNDSIVGPTLDFEFANPTLKITLSNQFGLESGVVLSPLKGISENGNRLTSSVSGVSFGMARPADPYSASFVILPNSQTSTITGATINTLLKPGPTSINYGLILTTTGSTSNVDFIHDNSKITAQSELRLPFHGKGKFFNLQTDVQYPGATDATGKINITQDLSAGIKQATFGFLAENSIPIAFEITLKFLDANKSVIDEIKTTNNGPAIKVDGATFDVTTKRSNSTKNTVSESIIDIARFEKINKECKFVRINARPQTTDYQNGSFVKVFPTDKLNIKMFVIADIKVEQK